MKIKNIVNIITLGLMVSLVNPVQAHWFTDSCSAVWSWVKNTISAQTVTNHSGKLLTAAAVMVGLGVYKTISGKNAEIAKLQTQAINLREDINAGNQRENEIQNKMNQLTQTTYQLHDSNAQFEKQREEINKAYVHQWSEGIMKNVENFHRQQQLDQKNEMLEKIKKELEQNNQELQLQCDKLLIEKKGFEPKEHPFAKAGVVDSTERVLLKPKNLSMEPMSRKEAIEKDELNENFNRENKEGFEQVEWAEILNTESPYKLNSIIVKPSFLKNKKEKILLICVHGTWSDGKAFGKFDSGNSTTDAIKKFAGQLAYAYECAVEIQTFEWTGALNPKDRAEAAKVLASHIQQQRYGKDTTGLKDTLLKNDAYKDIFDVDDQITIKSIWTIAHSHGCNVVSKAAQIVRNEGGKDLDVGIHMASPSPEIKLKDKNDTFAFKKLYHFWGMNDFTGFVGSMQSQGCFGRKYPVQQDKNHKVYNIRICNGVNELNHINIKLHVMQNLASLLYAIDRHYACHFDLNASVDSENYPLVALRDQNVLEKLDVKKKDLLLAHARLYDLFAKDAFTKKYTKDINHEKIWQEQDRVGVLESVGKLGSVAASVVSEFFSTDDIK